VAYALPNVNEATCVTLYRMRKDALLIEGLCGDMTWNSDYGPYATGGGWQAFARDATLYPPARIDPQTMSRTSELRWETAAD
jgi:hypothetical protein